MLVAWAAFGFLAAAATYFTRQIDAFRSMVFNADLLLTEDLYRHFVQGNDFSRWAWSAATYWFPDSTLYFALRFLTGNLQAAAISYALAQVVLCVVGIMALSRLTFRKYVPAHDALIIACGALYLGGAALWLPGAQYLLGPVLHGGVALTLLFALALVIWLLVRPATRPGQALAMATLGALAFAATLSDLFFVPQVLVPLGGALLALAVRLPAYRRRAAALAAVLGVASTAGFVADRMARTSVDNVSMMLAPDHAGRSLAALAGVVQQAGSASPLHAALIALWLGGLFAYTLRRVRGAGVNAAPSDVAAVVLGAALAVHAPVELAFVVLAGIFSDITNLRYFVPLLVLPTGWGFVLLLSPWSDGTRRAVWLSAGCAVAISAIMLAQAVADAPRLAKLSQVTTYYPADVACLDEQLSPLGVTRGVATYWQARPTALLSRNGLELAQVTADLAPFYWENDLSAYDIEPQFILLDRRPGMPAEYVIDEKRVRARFGAPAAIIDCADARALVYNRPSDTALPVMFKGAPGLASFRRAGDSYTYQPANLPGAVGRVDGLGRTVAGGPPGFLTFGPYVPLPPGDYALVIEYAAQSPSDRIGAWDVSIARPGGDAIAASGTLTTAGAQARGAFSLAETGIVEVRIMYAGPGSLTVSALKLAKLK
ncbi:MAG: hypothetical protein HZB53_13170 [Chloroflexi bacterium]|nr:hypothetical protein [Chloroflexota bacterium]